MTHPYHEDPRPMLGQIIDARAIIRDAITSGDVHGLDRALDLLRSRSPGMSLACDALTDPRLEGP